MSKSTITLVPASRVRAAFAAGEFKVEDAALPSLIGRNGDGKVRGRLNPLAVKAFNEQVDGEEYAGEKSAVESKSITLPLTKMNAAGARLKRPESFPLAEVRRFAGVEGKKGRLSAAEVAKAVEAVETERGWNVKPTKAAPKARTVNVAAPVEPTEG